MHLYQPDNLVPATRLLLDAHSVHEYVRSRLHDCSDLKIQSIRYKPRTSCLVSYEARCASEAEPVRFHAKAFALADWPAKRGKLVSKNPSLIVDDELAFALFQFPLDDQVVGLVPFFSRPNELLARTLFQSFRGESVSQVATLAYKPNRRYTAKVTFESEREAVLKLHAPSSFARASNAAQLLKKTRMRVTPDRWGRSNRHQAFLYQWISGRPIELTDWTSAASKLLVEQALAYLDRLHIPVGFCKRSQAGRQSIAAMAGYLGEVYPPIKRRAETVVKRLLASEPTPSQPCVIHGDFHENQVLVSQGEVTACDLDNCRIGEPTLDAATLVAHLYYRACSGELTVDRVAEIHHLISHRMARSRRLDSYLWNLSSSIFRLASHPFRSGSSQWIDRTERLMGLLETQLNDAGVPDQIVGRRHLSSKPHELRRRILQDPKFSFLAGAFDGSIAQREVAQNNHQFHARYGEFQIVAVRGWRHKRGRRCMLQFTLQTSKGPRSVLGKVSAKRLDRQSFSIQTMLADRGVENRDSLGEVSVPRPLGCLPLWNMWFQEHCEGSTVGDLLEKGLLNSATNLIADAITWLHRSDIDIERTHTIDDELSILRARLAEAAAALPEKGRRIQAVMNACEAILRTVQSDNLVTLHRDYYHDQILKDESRAILLDLDLVSQGPPALDIGNFLAHLTEQAIRVHHDPGKWATEEADIAARYLQQNPAVSMREITAFKIASLARHIAISASRAERRGASESIIEEVELLIRQFQGNAANNQWR